MQKKATKITPQEVQQNYQKSLRTIENTYGEFKKSFVLLIDNMDGDKKEELHIWWNAFDSRMKQLFEKNKL